MKGGILRAVTDAPLTRPQSTPTRMAPMSASDVENWPAISMAPQTPVSPTIDPTDRSIPPEAMTTVIPIAMMVITVVCRMTEERLLTVRKKEEASDRNTKRAEGTAEERKRY